jgi:hypothetical protein
VVDQEVYLCTPLASIGGVLARFCSSQRSWRVLGIHRLPSRGDPAALFGVVLDHPIHQLLEKSHPPPSLETLVDDARAHSEPIPMNSLPLAAAPKHIPIWALITARSEALGLPPRLVLFLFLGRHFLSFLHRGLGRRKQSTFLVVVASFIRRISFENGNIDKPILREVRLSSSFTEKFSDRV